MNYETVILNKKESKPKIFYLNSSDNDYVVRGIKAPTFELILKYMYTG